MTLLEDLGFGLDLETCAVTGGREDLGFVSPKSGRAVSRKGAGEWAERLLPLSPLMVGRNGGGETALGDGLRTTGYFLSHWLAHSLGDKPLPPARERLVRQLEG